MIATPGGTVRGEVGVGVKVDSGNGPGLRFVASRLGAPTPPAPFYQLPVSSFQSPTAPSWRQLAAGERRLEAQLFAAFQMSTHPL